MWRFAAPASLEVAAVAAVASGHGPGTLVLALALHVASAAAGAVAFERLLPERYGASRRAVRPLFFALCLLLPGLGPLGLAAAVGWGMRRVAPPVRQRPRQLVHPPSLAGPFVAPVAPRPLSAVLRGAGDPEERARAVRVAMRLPLPEAVRLLRLALADPAEDVRLLAYAQLERRSAELDRRVQAARAELDGATPEDRGFHHERLAREQWELVHAGLVDGELRRHALHAARTHLEQALGLEQRGDLHLRHGRVLLALGELAVAGEAFAAAGHAGVARAELAPWLAEVAFREGRFCDVGRLLAPAGGPRVAAVRRYWS